MSASGRIWGLLLSKTLVQCYETSTKSWGVKPVKPLFGIPLMKSRDVTTPWHPRIKNSRCTDDYRQSYSSDITNVLFQRKIPQGGHDSHSRSRAARLQEAGSFLPTRAYRNKYNICILVLPGTGYCFRAISFFVSMSARLPENGRTNLHEISREGVEWPWDDLIKFWVNSGKRVGRSKFVCYHRP